VPIYQQEGVIVYVGTPSLHNKKEQAVACSSARRQTDAVRTTQSHLRH